MHSIMKNVGKHVAALILFLGLVMAYFSPAVFDGKVIRQGDNVKAAGMGGSQVDKYAKTAEPGEFSVWSDAMFSGMPYGPGYGNPAPGLPSYSIVETTWIYSCCDGFYRIGMFLPIDVHNGGKLVVGNCRGYCFCLCFL